MNVYVSGVERCGKDLSPVNHRTSLTLQTFPFSPLIRGGDRYPDSVQWGWVDAEQRRRHSVRVSGTEGGTYPHYTLNFSPSLFPAVTFGEPVFPGKLIPVSPPGPDS